MKKLIALLAAMTMCVSMLPAYAETEDSGDYAAIIVGQEGGYPAVSTALLSAKDGDTVKMLKDYTYNSINSNANVITSAINISNKKNITIDMNDCSINFDRARIAINNGSSVTIKNGTVTATGKRLEGANLSIPDSPISVFKGGELTLDNVTVSNTGIAGVALLAQGKLNINNCNITGTYDAVQINQGDVTINGENTVLEGTGFDAIFIRNPGAKLTINNGTIKGAPYAILGNGTNSATDYRGGTEININGGTISGESIGMYLPQYGEVNITQGSITGKETAIEIESGILNISGGTFTSTTNEVGFFNPKPSDGTTVSGAAVAAVCRTKEGANHQGGGGYYGDMDINISGGTFNGVYGVAKLLYSGMSETSSMKNMQITGGTFNSGNGVDSNGETVTGQAFYVADDCTNRKLLSGGKYSTDVSEYVADNHTALEIDGMYEVVENASATINKVGINEANKSDVEEAMENAGFTGDENTTYQLDTAEFNAESGNTIFVNYKFNNTVPYTLKFETANLDNTNVKLGIVLYNIPSGTTVSEPSIYIQ